MKVFLGWSGQRSYEVASVLHEWLPYVIQAARPFLSSDISKGARWNDNLAEELKTTDFGILCVTPFNTKAPWLNFESGALSKAIEHSGVVPFLFNTDRSVLEGSPLSQFQSILYTEDDLLALLRSINARLSEDVRLADNVLVNTFNQWWPGLKKKLDEIEQEPADLTKVETETEIQWLYTSKDLARIEHDCRYEEIWVITPTPDDDLHLGCVIQALQCKLQQGMKYTFVMPASETSAMAQEALRRLFASGRGKLVMWEVPQKEFDKLAVTHYLVLRPKSQNGTDQAPKVFLELPIENRGFWIETDPTAALKFTLRFEAMIANAKSIPSEIALLPRDPASIPAPTICVQ